MSYSTESRNSKAQSGMNSPTITPVIKLIISRSINTSVRQEEVFRFAGSMTNVDKIKEALLYLEHADWNSGQAHTQRDLDRIDRAGPELDSDGEAVENHTANQKVDRRMAKPGEDYDPSLTKIKLRHNGRMNTFVYQHVETLDHTSQADINNLNRWRHSILRKHVGIAQPSLRPGTDFHPLEQTFLLNRYAEQEIDDRGHCKYDEITQAHNTIFQHEFLPGRAEPCEARTRDSISRFLTRRAINPKEVGRRWPAHFNAVMRHAAAQERIKEEWRERVKGNDNAENVSEMDDDRFHSIDDEEYGDAYEVDQEDDEAEMAQIDEERGTEDEMDVDETASDSNGKVEDDEFNRDSASGSEYQDGPTDDEDD